MDFSKQQSLSNKDSKIYFECSLFKKATGELTSAKKENRTRKGKP